MNDLELLRRKLASSCRVLAKEGHADGTAGHVSARIDSETFLMKPAGFGLEEIGPDDLVVLNLEGQKLEGKHKAHNEVPIHSEIYRMRPDVGCVIHTHPLFSITFFKVSIVSGRKRCSIAA